MNHSRHPTIYDVAALAGVSIATVSKSINNPAQVREETRAKVMEAVRSLDFVAKESAISRARRGTHRIAVLAPFTSYSSFAERLNGVLLSANGRRIEVVVQDMQSAAEAADVLERLPAVRSVDGIVIMSIPFGAKVDAALRRARLATVLVDMERHGYPSVVIDDVAAGRLAAEVLLESARTRPAFIGHRQVQQDVESQSQKRFRGFCERFAEAGITVPPERVVLVGNDFDEAKQAARTLLRGERPADAIFAHSDDLAAAAIAAAAEANVPVPEKLAVVGFDDSPVAAALGLTTIRQPLRESGEWALQTLLSTIANPEAPAPSVSLPVAVVRRRTA